MIVLSGCGAAGVCEGFCTSGTEAGAAVDGAADPFAAVVSVGAEISVPFGAVTVVCVGGCATEDPFAAVVSEDRGTSLPVAPTFVTPAGTSAPVVCVTVVCSPDGTSAPFAAVLTDAMGVVSRPFAPVNTENSGAATPFETMFATGNAVS